MTIEDWLETQLSLQREAFQLDPTQLEGEALAEYVTWNAYALSDELHELTQEIQWKPWATGQGEIFDHYLALTEFVDMMHFMANLALAFNFSHEDIAEMYLNKVQVNRDRQEEGYDGRSEKCPNCHRDLKEAGVKVDAKHMSGITIRVEKCGACGWQLSEAKVHEGN